MVSLDDRPEQAADRRVPGSWEGDLIIGKAGKSAAATLVERTSKLTMIWGLPAGNNADELADVLIDTVDDMPNHILGALTWDQDTAMARYAALTTVTDLPVCFAYPHAPWERGTKETSPSPPCREVPSPTA